MAARKQRLNPFKVRWSGHVVAIATFLPIRTGPQLMALATPMPLKGGEQAESRSWAVGAW